MSNPTSSDILKALSGPARAAFRRQLGTPGAKPSKYRNVRTKIDGINFDSKKEAGRYVELTLAMGAGECWFVRQPCFDTGGGTTYRADFLVVWRDGSVSVEDVKGMRTAAYKRSKKQVEARYPIKITEL